MSLSIVPRTLSRSRLPSAPPRPDRPGSRAVLAVAAFLVMLLGPVLPAMACSCEQPDFDEAVEQADLIALVSLGRVMSETDDGKNYSARTETLWKGEQNVAVDLFIPDGEASCGFDDLDTVYGDIMFLTERPDGSFTVGPCSTPKGMDVDEVRDALNEEFGAPSHAPEDYLIEDPADSAEDEETTSAPTGDPAPTDDPEPTAIWERPTTWAVGGLVVTALGSVLATAVAIVLYLVIRGRGARR